VLGLVLKNLGAKIYEASSAGSALESLITRRPDLLISDLRMAGMDGFGLVEAIRALPESLGGRTPAIALSGAPASQVVARVMKSGFQAFLQKPLNENELLLAVPALVGRRHTQEA
jgi:CheY-like chemotaxis protein